MGDRSALATAAAALALAAAVALAGWFVGDGLYRARKSDRYVSVKGFAEREVPANLALWPIVFSVTANDLGTLQRQVDEGTAKIRAFLGPAFGPEEISAGAPRITDREAQGMISPERPGPRYVAEAVVTVRTSKIGAVRETLARSGELVGRGVALIRSYEYNTQYLFTDLESIKPPMIAEATQDARRAAEQFARDSGSRVGGIRNAQQGLFSVEDRDSFSPEVKKVRVVTTVQFFLED
ncbi:MAG: SIMPL domain-containing protein [Thermodesulfobacteriota bacterium]|jgi:hypothetical protein